MNVVFAQLRQAPTGDEIARLAQVAFRRHPMLLVMSDAARTLPTVGFLTVIEDAQFGHLGGYLILNVAGRPVEFHCTAPIQPSRAQQILYGPTLRPLLYGEQIGPALIARSKSAPLFVCTDAAPCLATRKLVETPIVLVGASEATIGHRFTLGELTASVDSSYIADEGGIAEHWRSWLHDFDLLEPFGRIREAIEEAQRSARPAA